MRCCYILVLLNLLALANRYALSDEIPTERTDVPVHSDSVVASIDKDTRSFVTATSGSAYALTLTTFLTDAAHLHYVVLPAGHSALDAAGIKTAAAQCRSHLSTTNAVRPNKKVEIASSGQVVAADTITVSKAQEVVRTIESLRPKTSYDVFFVAEVVDSNGVFGPVQAVLQSTTHSEPPELDSFTGIPADATADTVVINVTLTTPGRVYFALIPSEDDVQLTAKDLIQNRSIDGLAMSQYAVHTVGVNESLSFQVSLYALTPATVYDVFVLREAPGNGEVLSKVIRYPSKIRTHALAPEVVTLTCSPLNASATALDVSFQIKVDEQDLTRVKLETLSYFVYNLHYEVIALSDGSNKAIVPSNAVSNSTGEAASSRSTDDSSVLRSTTTRGIISMPNFSSVEDFRAGVKKIHHANITGLQSGVMYKVKLRAQTAGSNGLFGLQELTAQATTHEDAPVIVGATIKAPNNSVNSLALTVDLERQHGRIHYVLTRQSGATDSLRSVFRQATGVSHLLKLLHDRLSQPFEENAYSTGVFTFCSEEQVPILDTRNQKGARSERTTEKANVKPFRQQFEITGLKDAMPYSIVLLPETTKSFGLFGRAYHNILEAHTNENASEVAVRFVKPLYGNITAIQVEVKMTKPSDILYLCLFPLMPSEDKENELLQDCREVEDRHSVEVSNLSLNIFSFTVANLSEISKYQVSLYAENALRNGVVSLYSEEKVVRTHKRAPHIIEASAQSTAGTTSQIDAKVVVELASPCIVHYVVREALESLEIGTQRPVDAATIVKHSSEHSQESPSHPQHLPSSSSYVASGNIFSDPKFTNSTEFKVKNLDANTTYELFVVTETSRDGNSSGVFGEVEVINVTTHSVAPKLVLATVDPVDGSTDSVLISVNLSHPGIVHYFISDVDFADPAIISRSDDSHIPHELRGQFMVLQEYVLMEIQNGTNDSQPVEPAVFVHNVSISGLKSGTTYHVSLTTETYKSHGVFGEFPPPVLVNTHLGPPVINQETFFVHPVDGSSSALNMDFELDRFGDVHYALFFRGLVPDRSHGFLVIPVKPQSSENKSNESVAIWPPVVSTFDLTQLNGSMLKAATLEELGMGVWVNDTISISREEMARGKTTRKTIDKLPANALFDLCLVTETAASGGILGWPLDGSRTACHRVKTHADYTNQSKLLDEISVLPLKGRTDAIRINLNVSKRLNAPLSTDGNALDRFALATGRVPYFVLIDAHAKTKHGLGAILSHRGEVTSAFKSVSPRRGDGIVAAGMLLNITHENASALIVEQNVVGLKANHDYLLYFAYETSSSNGVFTQINPHKHRGNDSHTENDGILVTTYEAAPRIVKAKAQPSFGHTSRIAVKFDIVCESCKSALVHILVVPINCIYTTSVTDMLRLDQVLESETNVTITPMLNGETSADTCTTPLVQKRVELTMSERQHNRNDIEEEVGEENVLSANTSYFVLLATETVGAHGVFSTEFEKLQVCTHAIAPKFTKFQLQPRIGSTTELVLTFALARPGEVHYMLGLSDNAEFNVTSPYNISSKGMLNGNRNGHGKDVHDYRTEVVRTRRSVTLLNGEHVELLDYLMPGTSYSLYLVAEALPADHGVYGHIHEVNQVSTFANAPILLAHVVYPTPGTTESITVGFRVDAPGLIYFSAVAVTPWDLTHDVAQGSDKFGNRLALKDQLVSKKSMEVNTESLEHESDSGWREIVLQVPKTEVNYSVHIVTETKNSGGIYGAVATHTGVRVHSEAPELVNVVVNPTDARVDALTVNITLNNRGHVHYVAVPSGRGSGIPLDDVTLKSTELSFHASGSIDVNLTTNDPSTSFVVSELTEGTSYDLYFRSETFESFGVFGLWTKEAVTARTHSLPADILPEAVECTLTPSCEQLGREVCSRSINICGKCLEGYGVENDKDIIEDNKQCVELTPIRKAKRGPTIRINGVTRNPYLQLPRTESETQSDVEIEPKSMEPIILKNKSIDLNLEMISLDSLDSLEGSGKPKLVSEINQEKTIETIDGLTEPRAIRNSQPEVYKQLVEQESPGPLDQQAAGGVMNVHEPEPISNLPETSGCPLNAQPNASGLCECIFGYEVDERGFSCVPLDLYTDSEAATTATSTAFDIFNVHHHISSQSM